MSEITIISSIAERLNDLSQEKACGELILMHNEDPQQQWHLYLHMGRVVYATATSHRVRRWERAVRQVLPHLAGTPSVHQPMEIVDVRCPWELQVLTTWLESRKITAAAAKAVVNHIVREVFFDFIENFCTQMVWLPYRQLQQHLVFLCPQNLVEQAYAMRADWQNCGLGRMRARMPRFQPNMAPVLCHPEHLRSMLPTAMFEDLLMLLQGQLTIWDVAVRLKRSPCDTMRLLLPLVGRGVVHLQPVEDLPLPVRFAANTLPEVQQLPLIAVVGTDDYLPTLLRDAGYEVMVLAQPDRNLLQLLRRRPALFIFTTADYEFCQLLRQSRGFSETPVLFLLSSNGLLEKTRVRWAGGTLLLPHPVSPAKLAVAIEDLLSGNQSPAGAQMVAAIR
jgi:chemotaxis family two-component system response regulator PixG